MRVVNQVKILGHRNYVEIPGEGTLELPPLLIRSLPKGRRLEKVVGMATDIVDSEDLLPLPAGEESPLVEELGRRKFELAINLVDQYMELIHHWQWGDSIVEWIRQCEMTFGHRIELRNLLHPDVWPHAARSSFVTLLTDKNVSTDGVHLERAVGLRLTFRQPPPISCFSNQFLFYLNGTVAHSAYQAWAHLAPEPISSLPPERFAFQVVAM